MRGVDKAVMILMTLISVGTLGLLEALERFDPSRHTLFKTFALHRVRGAILDELRKMSWAPRSTIQKIRNFRKATQRFEQQYGFHPSDNDLGLNCQLTPQMIDRIRQDEKKSGLIIFSELMVNVEETRVSDQNSGALQAMVEKETQDTLTMKIKNLPYPQSFVLAEYYFEERSMKDIGKKLNITESRVSQIHAQAIRNIKRRGD